MLVSVLIRVRNEEQALGRLLDGLCRQTFDRPFEIVVLDNESEDGSVAVAAAMGARVYTLRRSLFGYGRALNTGAALCRGHLMVLLSAHSWPRSTDWLSTMVGCMEDDGLAAAYCRQVADKEVSEPEQIRFRIFAGHDYTLDRESLVRRCHDGEDVYDVCCFSNAAAIVRRTVVLRLPFRNLPFAEDRAFVLDCLTAGHSIAYLSSAVVAYDQPATIESFYRIGRAGNIAKHLIRELGSTVIGTAPGRPAPVTQGLRLPRMPPETAADAGSVLRRDRSIRAAARHAAISGALFLGGVVGSLTWQRYRETAGRDAAPVVIDDTAGDIAVSESA